MRNKKFLSVLLVGALTIGILGGCGNREIPTEETSNTTQQEKLVPEENAKLKFWVASGKLDYGKAVGAAFEKEYGVPVEVEEQSIDIINKMTLDAPAGNGADVFMAAHDLFLTARDSGILAELNPNVEKVVREEANEIAVKTVEDDGKLYGVPVSIECYALLYNKDLVKGEPATTMEQIAEEAKEYNNPKENKFWFLTIPTEGYPAFPYLSVDGFQPFGPDGKDNDNPGFDTPEFEKGLQRIADLKEIIPIKGADLKMETITQLEQNFKDGKTAYYPIGPWLIKSLKEEKINFGVTTLPTWDGKQLKTMAGVQNAYVSSYSKYPNAAQLFAQYLISKEGASILYKEAYNVTARKNVDDIEGLKDDAELKVFVESFKDAVPMPQVKRVSYYWTVLQGMLKSVFDHDLTPQDAAKKAQEDFEALVASE